MSEEEIVKLYGQEVLTKYHELFFDPDLEFFEDRFCGFVGERESWSWDCYCSSGAREMGITYDHFMDGLFEEHYYYDEEIEVGFVLYNS